MIVDDDLCVLLLKTVEILFMRVLNEVLGSVVVPEQTRLQEIFRAQKDSSTIPPVDSKARE